MSTLLAVISCPADNETLRRNWPYLMIPNWDVLGCGTIGGETQWPGKLVERLDTGPKGVKMTPAGKSIWGLAYQELHIWEWFLNHKEYDSVCVVEADGVFTRKLPDHPGGAYLFSQMPNLSAAGLFKSSVFAQTPRWSDRPTTERLLRHTGEMLHTGDAEFFMSDRLPAWVCYKHRIKFQPFPAWSPFGMTNWENKSFREQWIHDARMAIKMGAAYIHSVKTQAQLDSIKDLLPCPA